MLMNNGCRIGWYTLNGRVMSEASSTHLQQSTSDDQADDNSIPCSAAAELLRWAAQDRETFTEPRHMGSCNLQWVCWQRGSLLSSAKICWRLFCALLHKDSRGGAASLPRLLMRWDA